jgi:hypothetical protein
MNDTMTYEAAIVKSNAPEIKGCSFFNNIGIYMYSK